MQMKVKNVVNHGAILHLMVASVYIYNEVSVKD